MTKRERLSERPWTRRSRCTRCPRPDGTSSSSPTSARAPPLRGSPGCARCRALWPCSTSRGAAATVCRVAGHVSATVGQTCVVTLEPIENEVDEEIDLQFAPTAAAAPADHGGAGVAIDARDGPEPLTGGVVDLGVLATEFLILGVDPYPRKPGAVLEVSSAGDDSVKPFAVLAALKKGQGGSAG